MQLVGISGFKRSGKDTAGARLTGHHGYVRYAFGDALKEMLATMDPMIGGTTSVARHLEACGGDWDRALEDRMHGAELKHLLSALRTQVLPSYFAHQPLSEDRIRWILATLDPYLGGTATLGDVLGEDPDWEKAKEHRIHGFEVRRLMQVFGTEAIRATFGDDAWVGIVERAIASDGHERVVVTDARFPSEAAWVKARGGIVVRMNRATGAAMDTHASETPLPAHLVDREIDNNRGLAQLHNTIDALAYSQSAILTAA